MNERLLLSQHKLTTFLVCQRRFQLRYLEQRPWPEAPLPETDEARLGRGQQFHQLVQRHFLGLKVEPATIADQRLRRWWLTFSRHQPGLPHGRALPELTLTIPMGAHLLHGRFDLLILGEKEGVPFAHVFDWKTGTPQTDTVLRETWQTRLYLAMLAEGAQALRADGRRLLPDHIAITYWYTSEPETPRIITYSQAWHEQNWAEISTLVAHIEAQQRQDGTWPLTDDWSQCRACAYRAFCGRQGAGRPLAGQHGAGQPLTSAADDESALDKDVEFLLEPGLP